MESHNLIRRGLRDLLDGNRGIEVVGVAANAHEALESVRAIPADLAVVGVRLSDSDGVELARTLRNTRRGLRVLILAPAGDRSAILRAVSGGAHGFLQIDVAEELLVSVVRGLGRGHTMFNPQIAEALVQDRVPEAQLDRIRFLTPQERLVLELLAQGMPNRDIAARAHLAEKTVRNYVSTIFSKLGVRSRAECVAYLERELRAEGASRVRS